MITISFADGNDVVFSVPLDGVTYKLRMCWNKQAQFWTLHLWDDNENVILANVCVVPNFPLLMNHHVDGAPRGEILAATKLDKITRTSFKDGSCYLVYCTESEWYR